MKKKDFAKKMGKWPTRVNNPLNPSGSSYSAGKKDLKAYVHAKKNKKKEPFPLKNQLSIYRKKDPEYAKMTIKEYCKKYPDSVFC